MNPPYTYGLRKFLAIELGVSPGYVSAMRRAGLSAFATADEARAWQRAHPAFRRSKVYRPGATKAEAPPDLARSMADLATAASRALR